MNNQETDEMLSHLSFLVLNLDDVLTKLLTTNADRIEWVGANVNNPIFGDEILTSSLSADLTTMKIIQDMKKTIVDKMVLIRGDS